MLVQHICPFLDPYDLCICTKRKIVIKQPHNFVHERDTLPQQSLLAFGVAHLEARGRKLRSK